MLVLQPGKLEQPLHTWRSSSEISLALTRVVQTRNWNYWPEKHQTPAPAYNYQLLIATVRNKHIQTHYPTPIAVTNLFHDKFRVQEHQRSQQLRHRSYQRGHHQRHAIHDLGIWWFIGFSTRLPKMNPFSVNKWRVCKGKTAWNHLRLVMLFTCGWWLTCVHVSVSFRTSMSQDPCHWPAISEKTDQLQVSKPTSYKPNLAQGKHDNTLASHHWRSLPGHDPGSLFFKLFLSSYDVSRFNMFRFFLVNSMWKIEAMEAPMSSY